MEGVVRVSSVDTNDRRNRWETGNEGEGGGGEGRGERKKRARARPWASRKRPKTNESPYPLSFSLPSWALPPTGGATATLHIPPLLGGKVGQIGKVRFPRRTTLSCTHARRFVTSFFRLVRILLRRTIFPAFFRVSRLTAVPL